VKLDASAFICVHLWLNLLDFFLLCDLCVLCGEPAFFPTPALSQNKRGAEDGAALLDVLTPGI